MNIATPQQIAEQRRHLANVVEAYHGLLSGLSPWQDFAATPELAENLAWTKIIEARETLAAWTGVRPKPYMDAADLANEEAMYVSQVPSRRPVTDRPDGR